LPSRARAKLPVGKPALDRDLVGTTIATIDITTTITTTPAPPRASTNFFDYKNKNIEFLIS